MYKSINVGRPSGSATLHVALVTSGTRTLAEDLPDREAALAALRRTDFHRDPGEVAYVSDRLVLVGVGKGKGLDTERFRTTGGRMIHGIERLESRRAHLDLRALPARDAEDPALASALAEGMITANWRMDVFDGAASDKAPAKGRLTLTAEARGTREGLRRGLLLGDGMNFTRRLAATPPNVCTPAHVAGVARSLARQHEDLSCSVITYAQARRLGMGGLENVGKGSASKPCLVVLDWKPSRPRSKERLAFVGKTITYDTGGYSMKSGAGMRGMKYDKNGGMAVLGAMKSIAEAKLPLRVTALLPAAENMVSSEAYRPDDIIRMYNGVSVEVTNTDAEGRLVLADALAYACAKYRPTEIVDMATLTGGVVVALGAFCAGFWCNDSGLRGRLERASRSSDEKIWQLPLWPEHREHMRSTHADILNSHPRREAHPIQGAAFLSYFVDEDIPWAHVDIAGTSNRDNGTTILPPGPTGWGVRLLFELAEGHLD